MPTYPARPGSVPVGPEQVQHISARNKARIMARVWLLRDPHATSIAYFLLYQWRSWNGVCDPALSTISEAAGVGLTTVKARLKVLRACGLRWVNRGISDGRRFVQWTNAYLWDAPSEPESEVAPRPAPYSIDNRKAYGGVRAALPAPTCRVAGLDALAAARAGWALGIDRRLNTG